MLLVAMPRAPSSILAPSSKARSPSSFLFLLRKCAKRNGIDDISSEEGKSRSHSLCHRMQKGGINGQQSCKQTEMLQSQHVHRRASQSCPRHCKSPVLSQCSVRVAVATAPCSPFSLRKKFHSRRISPD